MILVEPFAEMLANAPRDLSIQRAAKDALAVSVEPRRYDKVLMKEAVHHVADPATLFANLHARLSPAGRLLLVHVPPELHYPLFEAALARSRARHADPVRLVERLRFAGFAVEREQLDYRHVIPKDAYFGMVAGRYMSLLPPFFGRRATRRPADMAERYAGEEVLEFADRFDFITAIKN